jgi:hypothetical protein
MDGKIDVIKENVKESFSLVKEDVERLNAAFEILKQELNGLEDKTRSSLEGVDVRQNLMETNVPKIMESHGKSLQSILNLNKTVIALNAKLAAVEAQHKNILKEHKKVHREMHRMKKSIYKRLDAQEKDIKKRALKPKKRKK